MNIYVFDMNFNLQSVIDDCKSCIWRTAYSDIGDFELYLSATADNLQALKVNSLLVREDDITVLDGTNFYKNVMILKNIDITTSIEDGNFLKVTGYELKHVLSQRIVWEQTTFNGNVVDCIKQLVNNNAISPTDTKRKIDNLVIGVCDTINDTIEMQVTGDVLSETIKKICESYGIGWEVFGADNKYILRIYKGVDRSYNQKVNQYVVFSDSYDNLYNTEYQLVTDNYCNCALIGGEGEGIERVYTDVNTDVAGLDRHELFVDARDLSRNKDSANEIPYNEYINQLKSRGTEKLAELQYTEGFSGTVSNDENTSFKFGVHYDLGDTVTVRNEFGIERNVKVLSLIDTIDDSGQSVIPQFNS